MQQTDQGAPITLFCHPEDDHPDIHHHPAADDGQLEGKSSSQVQATIFTGGPVTEYFVGKLKPQF